MAGRGGSWLSGLTKIYRLDPRTLLEGEAEEVVESLARAWS